jgi:hypothetical protein
LLRRLVVRPKKAIGWRNRGRRQAQELAGWESEKMVRRYAHLAVYANRVNAIALGGDGTNMAQEGAGSNVSGLAG